MTKRFTETVSTGIVKDNLTEKEYKCEMRIDDELLGLINNIADENEQLKSHINDTEIAVEIETEKCMQRVFDLIDDKLKELENDYERSVKAGMPTMGIYSEMELLESLKKEVFE